MKFSIHQTTAILLGLSSLTTAQNLDWTIVEPEFEEPANESDSLKLLYPTGLRPYVPNGGSSLATSDYTQEYAPVSGGACGTFGNLASLGGGLTAVDLAPNGVLATTLEAGFGFELSSFTTEFYTESGSTGTVSFCHKLVLSNGVATMNELITLVTVEFSLTESIAPITSVSTVEQDDTTATTTTALALATTVSTTRMTIGLDAVDSSTELVPGDALSLRMTTSDPNVFVTNYDLVQVTYNSETTDIIPSTSFTGSVIPSCDDTVQTCDIQFALPFTFFTTAGSLSVTGTVTVSIQTTNRRRLQETVETSQKYFEFNLGVAAPAESQEGADSGIVSTLSVAGGMLYAALVI